MQSRFFNFLKQENSELKTDVNTDKIIVCKDEKEILTLESIARFLGFKTYILDDIRLDENEDTKSFFNELFDISVVLYEFYNQNKKKILFIPEHTLNYKLPSQKNLKVFVLKKGEKISQNNLLEYLVGSSYEKVSSITSKGEYSINGDKVDIFCKDAFRILFFDDEIESIRKVDTQTQKSFQEELDEVIITPFLAYLCPDEYKKVMDKINSLDTDSIAKDVSSFGFWFIDGFESFLDKNPFTLHDFENFEAIDEKTFKKISQIPKSNNLVDLNITLSDDFFELNKNKKITLFYAYDGLLERFDIKKYDNIKLVKSDVVLNAKIDDELFISLNEIHKKQRQKRIRVDINDLSVGDFVTHEIYGIGKFMGLELISSGGKTEEMVRIVYQNDDNLYLPTNNIHLLDKYIFNNTPTLDRLGKNTFLKVKEKLAKHINELASKITNTAAQRMLINANIIDIPQNYSLFLQSSGFIHTPDQNKVLNEIFDDFKSKRLMDRLLSADVGFGKTEVAACAIFACVSAGFRACFLAPTTILSAQHYQTLKNRFQNFNVKVFRYDRFTSKKEKDELKKAIDEKIPFVVVGTHSLLSLECDYAFMVIDEEHKFGVNQKEKLKQISKNAHILSMSATPIPRSLSQALSSIKTYSTIQTPPVFKQDVKSFLKQKNTALIKEIISRELRRGGQIFYIHNHIKSIQNVAKYLLDLFSGLKILILHGQLKANEIEQGMSDFAAKKYDLLLCTSIVESGIDIKNANTIIIDDAWRFGLADLHQLRGRVGRGKNIGYCYFLVENEDDLGEEAQKRLLSLVANSYLGAGAILAYHDLEIRGAGNLLGENQSGKIEGVGYALYIKMLEERLNEIGKTKDEKVEIKLNISAFLNNELIGDDGVRLEIYRRLANAKSTDIILDIACELEDRFGKIDKYTKNYLDMMKIKILCKKFGFKAVSSFGANIKLLKMNDESIVLKASSDDDEVILSCILQQLYSKNN